MPGEYLDQALATFSGYIAADELYDGPFSILSIVDNRTQRRLMYEVLHHSPTHQDILCFFRRFKAALVARGLELRGITTDASALYPLPIAEVFGPVPHQICVFHILADLTKAVLWGLAHFRKTLAASLPPLGRGRPSAGKRKLARQRRRIQARIAELFEHRHLFVQRDLTPAERQMLRRLTRGERTLASLRSIMDEVYRLFDRRCRTDTALEKLAVLRRRVRRFKAVTQTLRKLFSPNLEKALTFLDDSLLPSTSNAVERGNRRYRKMQKSVYRVRSLHRVEERIALDMQRESQADSRTDTTIALHRARAA